MGPISQVEGQLVARWKRWRAPAPSSNIAPLQAFSLRLARYALSAAGLTH